MLRSLDVFVFTLGLTETWIDRSDGTAFPTAPGVIAGDPAKNAAEYVNLSIDDVRKDIVNFWKILTEVNPYVQMNIMVSTIPLNTTARYQHFLSASTHTLTHLLH